MRRKSFERAGVASRGPSFSAVKVLHSVGVVSGILACCYSMPSPPLHLDGQSRATQAAAGQTHTEPHQKPRERSHSRLATAAKSHSRHWLMDTSLRSALWRGSPTPGMWRLTSRYCCTLILTVKALRMKLIGHFASFEETYDIAWVELRIFINIQCVEVVCVYPESIT